MIFIIPIILGAAALVTAGVGAAAGVDGISKMDKAKKIGKNAQRIHEQRQKSVENALQATNSLAEEYGRLQIECKLRTIGRFVAFIAQIGQRASQSDMKFLEGLEGVSPQQVQEYKATALEAVSFASGTLKAVGTGYAASQGALGLIGLFGTASTGTAISGLGGAAAWNATLAWLGGGSLAAGGGGMALGTLVLGGIAVGPALMIGGFVLGGEGEKALTEAREYAAKVIVEVEKLNAFQNFLGQAEQRISELQDLINRLNSRALEGLEDLETRPFVRERDAEKFQQVALLIKALAEIMKTPVLTTDGALNDEAMKLQVKYRNL
ncbi:hypothetical protein [Geitlerinema sp. PCC 7407]|uniref:hypothetical protein n=1 Tax=Geitlerinema sp. PCC 7407 TaxID=1173025 RepID=UPI00029F9BC3|nr:hypothetical protein [Geitlerinema sp. PCC 7407]AFY66922.1 hypothetical protein GEI7407_2447 [Geitlerinema sp. PCC 7407]